MCQYITGHHSQWRVLGVPIVLYMFYTGICFVSALSSTCDANAACVPAIEHSGLHCAAMLSSDKSPVMGLIDFALHVCRLMCIAYTGL